MKDIPQVLMKVVEQYGREMVALVYGAGLASEATKVLAGRGQALRDRELLHATCLLGETFNQVSSAYCKQKGWTEAELAQCDRDIMLSFASAVQVAEAPKIIIEH